MDMDSRHLGISFLDFQTIVGSVINNPQDYGTFKDCSVWLYTRSERVKFLWESKGNYNAYYVLKIGYDSEREQRWTCGLYQGFDFDILTEHGTGHYLSEAIKMVNTSYKESRDGFYL